MTKKEFSELADYHQYKGAGRDKGDLNALFFNWMTGMGFKYCVYARACNATKKELVDTLYNFITGNIQDTPWYIQLVVAPSDEQRFKVPISGNGLYGMVKYKKEDNE